MYFFQERYNRIVLPFLFVLDISLVLIVYYLFIIYSNSLVEIKYLFSLIFLWSLFSIFFKSYRALRVHTFREAIKPTVLCWIIFSINHIFLFSINFMVFHDIKLILEYLLILLIFLIIVNYLKYIFFLNYRRKGKNSRNAILLGQININKQNKIYSDSLDFGFQFVGLFDNPKTYITDLEEEIKVNKINIVFLSESTKIITDQISNFCDNNGIRLKILLSLSQNTGHRAGLDIIGGFPVMNVRYEPLLYLGNRIIKRTIDILMSIASILFVLTWLPFIVKLAQIFTYPGPLFFKQDRIGHNGKIFKLYKFRTMYFSKDNNKAQKGNSNKTKEIDSRIPRFGTLLRSTNLDEYPQFLNVLFGSMSTVGPRPYMYGEDIELEGKIKRYKMRRFVKPGITGWAAINGYRGGTNDLSLMSKRTDFDIWYLENWSIWLDFKIMIITIWQMLTFKIPKAY